MHIRKQQHKLLQSRLCDLQFIQENVVLSQLSSTLEWEMGLKEKLGNVLTSNCSIDNIFRLSAHNTSIWLETEIALVVSLGSNHKCDFWSGIGQLL